MEFCATKIKDRGDRLQVRKMLFIIENPGIRSSPTWGEDTCKRSKARLEAVRRTDCAKRAH